MKTIIVYNDIENPLRFFIIEGDYSKFNGVCINSVNGTGFEEECCNFLFNEEGYFKHERTEDSSLLENKDWDKIAIVTFLP